MTLKDRITEDMKSAMRAKDALRLGTIRLLLAACKDAFAKAGITAADLDRHALKGFLGGVEVAGIIVDEGGEHVFYPVRGRKVWEPPAGIFGPV